jgi:putative Ca2+/H+ antiporter (TMEM165/GDT1 family)
MRLSLLPINNFLLLLLIIIQILQLVILLPTTVESKTVNLNTNNNKLIRQKGSRQLDTTTANDDDSTNSDVLSSGSTTTTTYTNKGFLPNSIAKNIEQWPFWSAFGNSVAMIVVTELGDKTFFIAAVMAMRHPRLVVYTGAMGALAGMTILSAAIGFALPQLLPKIYTHYASVILFAFFGIKLLQEAHELYTQKDAKKNEELKEVEEQLGIKSTEHDDNADDHDVEKSSPTINSNGNNTTTSTVNDNSSSSNNNNGTSSSSLSKKDPLPNNSIPSPINILSQAFTLTFFAEWGDRSQVATIALASVHDPFGVTFGGILGHALCTGLAVVGGRMLATKISEKAVALSGGILFIVFALHSLYVGP